METDIGHPLYLKKGENVMHLQHITFMVRDIEKSINFYEEMAELKLARRFQAGPTEVAFMTDTDGATEVEFVCRPEGQKFEGKGMFICFKTDKLDEKHQLALDKGLNPSAIQNPDPDTFYFYVYDPDGVSVQLRYYPK